jgi:hypothetical protein
MLDYKFYHEKVILNFTSFVSTLLTHEHIMLDKYDPATYNHQYATINGIRMHYVDENPTSKNALLLIHGWPDL